MTRSAMIGAGPRTWWAPWTSPSRSIWSCRPCLRLGTWGQTQRTCCWCGRKNYCFLNKKSWLALLCYSTCIGSLIILATRARAELNQEYNINRFSCWFTGRGAPKGKTGGVVRGRQRNRGTGNHGNGQANTPKQPGQSGPGVPALLSGSTDPGLHHHEPAVTDEPAWTVPAGALAGTHAHIRVDVHTFIWDI